MKQSSDKWREHITLCFDGIQLSLLVALIHFSFIFASRGYLKLKMPSYLKSKKKRYILPAMGSMTNH